MSTGTMNAPKAPAKAPKTPAKAPAKTPKAPAKAPKGRPAKAPATPSVKALREMYRLLFQSLRPHRMAILLLIHEHEGRITPGKLGQLLGLNQAVVSSFCCNLRHHGLCVAVRDGTYSRYRLTEDGESMVRCISIMVRELQREFPRKFGSLRD